MPKANPTEATVAMYDQIPEVYAGHFASFRSTLPEFTDAHELAGMPMGESQVVEIGCGDGRDAEQTFVPNSAAYVGYDPSKGLLDIARKRFADVPAGKVRFEEGYAQTTEYPTDNDVMMSVNAILHVPTAELTDVFERAGDGLRKGGVFYSITKVEDRDKVEVYNDDFNGVKGERYFYHHSRETLLSVAKRAGLAVVRNEVISVEAKPWDWGQFAVQKP